MKNEIVKWKQIKSKNVSNFLNDETKKQKSKMHNLLYALMVT